MGNRSPYPDDGLTRPDIPHVWPRGGDSPYSQAPYGAYPPPPPPRGPQRRGVGAGRVVLLIIGTLVAVLVVLAIIAPKRGGSTIGAQGSPTPRASATPAPPTATPLPGINAVLLYNNVGISDDRSTGTANFDVFGDSYSAQALQKGGLTLGGSFTYDGVRFTWPTSPAGTADNMQVQGQSVMVTMTGSAATLAFLGASHFGGAQCNITIVYRDGTQQPITVGMTDWTLPFGNIQYGNAIAATLPYYNSGTKGQVKQNIYLYYAKVALKSRQPIVRLDFSEVTTLAQIHLFAIGVK